ncbi:metallophosphoesterase [Azoarcus sp. CIB]|uniref:metallophosphoesterase n=1 Tax=Aromatoleum sp. (strain CIB) TaxID=198107 RepID=UPI00067C9CD8|nr:metallophosphoesterase [Azoarcus sp. CIB]
MPRLHILSDLHLETGLYKIPDDLEFDILVAAGDIGPPAVSVPWLAAVGKPVVYVLGNHEHWDTDYGEAHDEARRLAVGTQVHVLERNAVEIQGVRFLGCTLWADLGGGNKLIAGRARIRDYDKIRIDRWLRASNNVDRLRKICDETGCADRAEHVERSRQFCSFVYMAEHVSAMAWLQRMLRKRSALPTVVVTHHSPTYSSLLQFGLAPGYLERRWPRFGQSSRETVTRIGLYASDHGEVLRRLRNRVNLWVHGHLHAGMDFDSDGVRVICNPRGYALPLLVDADVAMFRMLGYSEAASLERIAADRMDFEAHPNRGEGIGFRERLVVRPGERFPRPRRALWRRQRAENSR